MFNSEYLIRQGQLKLLEIKDSDIRILTLEQARDAVDKGIHIGGAFSAVIPFVSLFYGEIMNLDVVRPTRPGQDTFVLSKGHAVATLASIYADLGYFDRSVLKNSRSRQSILNGHPGPILPGIPISTGPLGQGLSVAQGFALIGKRNPAFDSFCLTGDGELQEGLIWEAVMYASYKRLDNLCVMVDKNSGQLDDTKQLVFPLLELVDRFKSFGWKVISVDATQYGPVLDALRAFKFSPRDGRPTAVICRTRKGYGGFSSVMSGHKIEIPDSLTEQEIALQRQRRELRIAEFLGFFETLEANGKGGAARDRLLRMAKAMNLKIESARKKSPSLQAVPMSAKTRKAPPRDKRIRYDAALLPKLDKTKEYSVSGAITLAMRVFARDPRVVTIDADLASTSGLEAGVGYVDSTRAINVGIAEANMMNIGEAFAAMGYNAWVSTFCPFFDWKVLRRIAIGHQERTEAMDMKGGWLNEGHGLDLTFVATAPNFETKTNGGTHMGNDDSLVFDGIAHLKIIDSSCPQQVLSIMKWILEGNRGLVYLRILRAPSGVLYDADFRFDFGKGYFLRRSDADRAVIISSGRGVFEALSAAELLAKSGIPAGVVDMPSIDEPLLLELYDSGKRIFIAEQNNGFIWSHCQRVLFRERKSIDSGRLAAINTLAPSGKPQFIHSATYGELLDQFGLAPVQIAEKIKKAISR
jgi:transketolase